MSDTPTPIEPSKIAEAYERIAPFIHRTPLMQSNHLNTWLGHTIIFKVEGFQKIGAFKIRGALNALLKLKEEDNIPEHVVAFSSGNHAQAVALGCGLLGIKSTILMPEFASKVKQQATKAYGGEVVLKPSRAEAEAAVQDYVKQGAYFLHPYDDDSIIQGQGTSCFEALSDGVEPDAIFATCGGGGWVSGSYLAKELLYPDAKFYAAEPLNANDAAQSYRSGEIVTLPNSPNTIADGVRTLRVADRTFEYLKQLDGFYEVDEDNILYWSQWLAHLLKTTVEPTSAVAMGACAEYLRTQTSPKTCLVLLSGGNIDAATYQAIWQKDYLQTVPAL